jgi:hypothetical protein
VHPCGLVHQLLPWCQSLNHGVEVYAVSNAPSYMHQSNTVQVVLMHDVQ